MLSQIAFLLLLQFPLFAAAQPPRVFEGYATDTVTVSLGTLKINLVTYSFGEPRIRFIVVHDNEDTGPKAALEFIMERGGVLIDPQYGGVRNFRFVNGENTYEIDPNSIFTKPGIYAGLTRYSTWARETASLVDSVAKVMLGFYAKSSPEYFLTLHNNTEGGFSINSYLPGNYLETTADSVFINPDMDTDDFILVTRPAHFTYLKKEKINAVLQSNDPPNDGSLSVYAHSIALPYINVEVQHGNQDEHFRLIEVVEKMIRLVGLGN